MRDLVAMASTNAGTEVPVTIEVGREIENITILPSQMDSQNSGKALPEVWLLVALIDQAVAEYRLRSFGLAPCGRTIPKGSIPAREWLFGSQSQKPFTFLWCCSILGLDPEWLRAKIRSLDNSSRARRTRPIFVGRKMQGPSERRR